MAEVAQDISIVEALRAKTEQEDIRQYLKSTWGGYTKASVLEYLNSLRKQQQMTAETFSHNQQVLFMEKENLKRSNDALKLKFERLETEYRNLSESLRSHGMNVTGENPEDTVDLKCSITALEEELGKSSQDKSKLEKQLEQQKSVIEDYALKLRQAAQETLSVQTMLKAEMLESKKQRGAVLRLTNDLEEKDSEIELLKAMVSEGQLASLREKIANLTQQLKAQSEYLSGCNEEKKARTKEIEELGGECETLKLTVANLSNNLEELNLRNDKLLLANRSLSYQLEREYERSLELIQEKSSITAEKLLAARKLDEAGSKLALLELKLKKQSRSVQKDEVYNSAERTEEIKSQSV